MKSIFLLLFTGFLLAASAGAATYEVPVPEELAPHAKFPLEKFTASEKGGRLELRYQLPMALTGEPIGISLAGPVSAEGRAKLTGKLGKGECDFLLDGSRSCRVSYRGFEVDRAKVIKWFDEQGITGTERDAGLAVAAAFGGDMEGIIAFTLPADASTSFEKYE